MDAPPQLSILAAWAAIVLILLGLGGVVRWLGKWPARDTDALLRSVWLGFAVLVCFLQIWHLFLPIDARAVVVSASVGACGLVLCARDYAGALRHRLARNWHVILAAAIVAVWLANLSTAGPRFGDVGSYYVPMVRWISEYAIVPGLGNLYLPFGHGQSYLLYVAWLDVGPFARRSFHVANGVLLLIVFARGLVGAGRLLRREGGARPADVFYVCCIPALVQLAASIYLTSPMPEPALFVLGLVLSGELLALLDQPTADGERLRSLYTLILLAAVAVTLKLSIAGLAVCVALVALVAWMARARPSRGAVAVTFASLGILGGVVFGPWVVRNVISTGLPFFPSPFAGVPVEWRVTADMVEWIQGPIRPPPLSAIVHDPSWFLRRLQSLAWTEREVIEPLIVALAAVVVAAVTRLWLWRRRVPALVPAVVLLPTIVSLVFTLSTTPMPRYAGAAVWLIPIQILVIGCAAAILGAPRRWRVAIVTVVLAYAVVPVWREPDTLAWRTAFEPMSRTPVDEVTLPTGLIVHVPRQHSTCWDAPLPCTPEPQAGLRLRRQGEIGSGFWVDPSVPPADRAATP